MQKKLTGLFSGLIGVFILAVLSVFLLQCSRSSQPQVWVENWEAVSPLSIARTGAKAISLGDRIYVMGGGFGIPGPDTVLASVEFVKIKKDGTLGEWEKGPSMNTPRIFLAVTEADNVIYTLGGEFFPGGKMLLLNTVESSRVASNGELGPWRKLSSMLTPRRSPTTTVAGGYLYAIGGYNGVFLSSVERAKILPGGDLGPWEWVSQSLTMARYIHGGATIGNRIYVMGGHLMEAGGGTAGAESAVVNPDGSLSPWKTTSPLSQPRFLSGSAALGGNLFIAGGYDGEYLDSVEMAKVLPDGNLGSWDQVTPLPKPREGPAMATNGKHIYAIGGSRIGVNKGVYLREVDHAEISMNGNLGHWKDEK